MAMYNLKRKNEEETKTNKKVLLENDTSEDVKHSKLIQAVQNQGPLGQVVIIRQENESPYVTLQNSLSNSQISLNVARSPCDVETFFLKIDNEEYVSGKFTNIQAARIALAENALEQLKKICFFIDKKKCYTDVTNKDLEASSSKATNKGLSDAGNSSQSGTEASKDTIAHKMMLKMGWSGGGLGVQEQGRVDAVTVYENISRQGFGSKNVMREITKVLQDFSKSTKLTTLAFDSDFTKEERELIHRLARKFNLKSKSEGKEVRRLTVSRKLRRYDIVKELLKIGCENESYKLYIPSNFDDI